jgi:uncharacterized protein (DUF1501 family)
MTQIRRRDLLKALGAATVLSALPLPAYAAGPVAAADVEDDYKAIVCINLVGGLDHLTMLTPSDTTSYNALRSIRGDMAVDRDSLLAIPDTGVDGRTLALHPRLTSVRDLYVAGRVAFVNGVGELEQPTTKDDLVSGRAMLPRAAGSHNDGQCYAHALAYEGARYGWGGRILDAVAHRNHNALLASVRCAQFSSPFCYGLRGPVFTASELGFTDNFRGIRQSSLFGSASASSLVERALVDGSGGHLLRDAVVGTNRFVLDAADLAKEAFQATEDPASVLRFRASEPYGDGTPYHARRDNTLGLRLETVARLMHQRSRLGVRRQVFQVDQPNYDSHGGMAFDLDRNLHALDVALAYFDEVLGRLGLSDRVLVFTSSEFGRGLEAEGSGGTGTGHGWGGGSLIMGGPVAGGQVVGPRALIGRDSPDFIGSSAGGSLIPGLAFEQVGATIARWFDVPETDIATIFPRLGRFALADLGFVRGTALAATSLGSVASTRSAVATGSAVAADADPDDGGRCGRGALVAAGLAAGLQAAWRLRLR